MPMPTSEQQREYQRRWIAARRVAFFPEGACVDCGSTEALELDHVDPATKVHHAIWSWSKERRDAEIAKCVVRCAPCHRERHTKPRRLPSVEADCPTCGAHFALDYDQRYRAARRGQTTFYCSARCYHTSGSSRRYA